jgi:hypothetical protein
VLAPSRTVGADAICWMLKPRPDKVKPEPGRLGETPPAT